MQHSHEAFDRPGGVSHVRLLAPLGHRDFRWLWGGMCVSLLGDGIFLVAMAWQVYALSNAPTALSLVGIAMTVPTIVLLLLGGALSDRVDRRQLLVAADLTRGACVAVVAVLSAAGWLELWHMCVLVAVYGAGAAFFGPAFDALVPDVLPREHLPQANALEQVIRPVALRMAGPAVGGLLVGTFGLGVAFALDAASFLACAAAMGRIRPRARAQVAAPGAVRTRMASDVAAGLRYIRGRTWLWGTFASAAIAYLLFMGPTEVLVAFLVKNDLHAGAGALGLVFAAGGVGSVLVALVMGQRGLPCRDFTWMYLLWGLATLAVAGYGLGTAIWQLMLACALFNALETAGTIIWATAKQRHVPPELLGRVSSLDWLISIGLLPLSFALTGPVSAAIGVRETLIAAAVLGAAVTLGALALPGMRAVEGLTRPAWAGRATYEARADRVALRRPGTRVARVVERPWGSLELDARGQVTGAVVAAARTRLAPGYLERLERTDGTPVRPVVEREGATTLAVGAPQVNAM